MAKFSIFSIAKANERIAELEALVTERDGALAAAQEEITNLKTAPGAEQAAKDLVTAKQTISSLTEANAKLTTDLAAAKQEATDAKAALEQAKASAEHLASVKAHEIVAGQGHPPVVVKPSGNPAAGQNTGTWTERALAAKAAETVTK